MQLQAVVGTLLLNVVIFPTVDSLKTGSLPHYLILESHILTSGITEYYLEI